MRRPLVCIANFSGTPDENYRVGLPFAGRWKEVLNTDAVGYAGSGVGNLGVIEAEEVSWHGRPASAVLRVPPLGAVWFVPERMSKPPAPPVRDRRGVDRPPSGTIIIPPKELEKALARETEVKPTSE
jgi:1,4-alpha-glucan branching enzyme